MAGSFAALFLLLFTGKPIDIVSFLEPKSALEALGEPTDEAGLKRLIEGKPGAAPASGKAVDEKAVKTAIENLASSTESVKARAREDLAASGEATRARLEDLVKTDPRRAAEAKAVIAELDAAASAAASRSGISRLLAVRLAGDRKLAALVEPIRALTSSPDPFLRDAAAETVARIEGKDPPPPPERPWAKSLAALETLPKETNYMIDLPLGTVLPALAGASSPRIDRVLGSMAALMGSGGDALLGQATSRILDFVAKCGNLRVDRLSFANVGLLGKQTGIVVILSGEYDRRLVERSLGSSEVEEVAGKKVYIMRTYQTRLVLLDDHHALFLPAESENFPLEEYIKAYASGSRPLRGEARWARFLGTLGSSARGLILMQASLIAPEGYGDIERELGPDAATAFKGWKEIDVEAKPAGSKKIGVLMEAEFDEAKHATDLAAVVKGKIGEAIAELESQAPQAAGTPFEGMLKSALDVLKSVQVATEGKKGSLRGELDPSVLLSVFTMRTVDAPEAVPEER